MNEIEFLNHTSISGLLKKHDEVISNKRLIGYNLFTISSFTYHKENFHSDIIFSFLNPFSLHNEGYVFLELFIQYINKYFQKNPSDVIIEPGAYKNVTVLRERGRLDLWIKDESSKHSIIIENKINDAADRDDQLLDYYHYVIDNGYIVDAIIYLSKDGAKISPAQSLQVEAPILNVAAFRNNEADLLNGWLLQCLAVCSNDDSRSFMYQYIKLLKHLTNGHMENEIKESFYQYVSQNKATNIISQLKYLIEDLPNYRAEKFRLRTENFKPPFGNRFRYQLNYWIFENYINREGSFKLDVFFESSGNAKVVVWNTTNKEKEGYASAERLLDSIGLKERFDGESRYNGLTAEFNISETFPCIEDMDNSVVDLVVTIFEKLKTLSK